METIKRTLKAVAAMVVALLSCACMKNESDFPVEFVSDKESLDFVAFLSPEQQANIETCGTPFLPTQQNNAWQSIVSEDIPIHWGLFNLPVDEMKDPQTKAVGIWGAYPAQYWTMIRVKTGVLDEFILNCMIMAIDEIETTTNVRFYNSTKDDESVVVGGTTIKLPNIKVNMGTDSQIEGTGSFGLIGGEQYIYVPYALTDRSKYTTREVVAFFLHAFCNAAGMFNEQQRKDRDTYVTVTLNNVKDACKVCFNKQTKNYVMQGNFDYQSVTLASSRSYSKNGLKTIVKVGGAEIAKNLNLSAGDIYFLNTYYLPYIGRTDNYIELDEVVYSEGRVLTEEERIQLQTQLNAQRGLYGTPPPENRIEKIPWN